MSEKSTIQWTDATHNFWQGCTKVSAGCAHCYAAARDKRFSGGIHWGKGSPRKRSSSFEEPLKWNKKPLVCDKCGDSQENDTFCYADGCDGALFHRRRVFSLSLGDWLDAEAPIELLADMLDVIRRCENLDWLLVTKRPELWAHRVEEVLKLLEANDCKWPSNQCSSLPLRNYLADWFVLRKAPANVMVLTSVEDQEAADKRIPELLKIPAARRGLSCEPLLGLLDISHWLIEGGAGGLDWVIAGCESGPHRRELDGYTNRARMLLDQCRDAGVPFFHKQMPLGKRVSGDISEWPKDLRTREFYR